MKIEVCNVSKSYKVEKNIINANKDINLSIKANEFIGIIGENGSGKTTLIREIMGIVAPDSGQIEYDNKNIKSNKEKNKVLIGYMSQSNYAALYNLTIKEAIEIIGNLKGISKKEYTLKIEELFDYFSLSNSIMKRIFYSLSGGQKRIISFCFSLLGDPQFIFLDEPSNDLDPHNRYLLWNYIKQLHLLGTTIVLVTHNIAEVESYITRVILVKNGEIQIDNEKKQLIDSYRKYEKIIMFFKNIFAVEKAIEQIKEDNILRYKKIGSNSIMIIEEKDKSKNTDFSGKFKDIIGYQIEEINLEDICFE